MTIPVPKFGYTQNNQVAVNTLNAASVEIARQANLPLACVFLAHPNLPGFGVNDAKIRAPILLYVAAKNGQFFNGNQPEPISIDQIYGRQGGLVHDLAEWFFDTSKDQMKFMKDGGFAIRTIDEKTAKSLPLVNVNPNHLPMIRETMRNDWRGWEKLTPAPSGFEKIHPYIHHYSSGNCWFYAQALADQMGGDTSPIALHLKATTLTTISGDGYHACVKTPDGLYHDIWGAHTLDEMRQRLLVEITHEEPMMDLLHRLDPHLEKERFSARVVEAKKVVVNNPMHEITSPSLVSKRPTF